MKNPNDRGAPMSRATNRIVRVLTSWPAAAVAIAGAAIALCYWLV